MYIVKYYYDLCIYVFYKGDDVVLFISEMLKF